MDPRHYSYMTRGAEFIFFTITVLATINCLKRPDWNFAFGLLSYFMIKSMRDDSIKFMLLILNGFLVFADIIWVIVMWIIWGGKPTHDKIIWERFSTLHSFILISSGVIIVLRIIAFFLIMMFPSRNIVHK